MKLNLFSVASLAILSIATALPTDTSTSNPILLERAGSTCSSDSFEADDGQVVTQAVAAKYLKDNQPKVGPKSVFYNGAGVDASQATSFAKSIGGHSYNMVWNEFGSKAFDRQCNWSHHVTTKVLQEALSGGLAEVSKGVAYLYTTDGTKLDPNNVWTRIEYPALKKNGVKVCIVAAGTSPRKMQWYEGESTIKFTAKGDECK
ncbi:hypothetical protein Daus18300_006832 [Diaporthe australafricana]|uniref:Secreted protein n=1 Tax=Diaporthe australafricana TaxID=127596 RepID=A0ABR3WRJ6_9PEZI